MAVVDGDCISGGLTSLTKSVDDSLPLDRDSVLGYLFLVCLFVVFIGALGAFPGRSPNEVMMTSSMNIITVPQRLHLLRHSLTSAALPSEYGNDM